MDIRNIAVQTEGVVELLDVDNNPLLDDSGEPLKVTVFGPGSREYMKAQAELNNRLLDRLKRKGKSEQSAEEKAREQIDFLVSCTKEFSPNLQYGDLQGEALFKAVYSDRSVGFIAQQVGEFIGEWSNFKKPSTKTSASTSDNSPG